MYVSMICKDRNEKEKNELYKKLFKNIMIAIVISIYFIFLNLGSVNIEKDIFLK